MTTSPAADSQDPEFEGLLKIAPQALVEEMDRARARLSKLVQAMEQRGDEILPQLVRLMSRGASEPLDTPRRSLRLMEANAAARGAVRLPLKYVASFEIERDKGVTWRSWEITLHFRDVEVRANDHDDPNDIADKLFDLSDEQIHAIALALQGVNAADFRSVSTSETGEDLVADLAQSIWRLKDAAIALSRCRDEAEEEKILHPLDGAMLKVVPPQIMMRP